MEPKDPATAFETVEGGSSIRVLKSMNRGMHSDRGPQEDSDRGYLRCRAAVPRALEGSSFRLGEDHVQRRSPHT